MLNKKEIRMLFPVIFILGIFVYFSDPVKGPILPCVFNKITGLYCPGCGITRAIHSVLKFEFYRALRYNALIFIIPPMLMSYHLLSSGRYIKLQKIILILMITVTLGYGILRNIDSFSYLSPTIESHTFNYTKTRLCSYEK